MPMKPREMENLILANGWMFKNQEGSHKNYIRLNREKSQYLFTKKTFP